MTRERLDGPPNREVPPQRRRQPASRYVLAEHPDHGYREAGQSMEVRRMACAWANEQLALIQTIAHAERTVTRAGGALVGAAIGMLCSGFTVPLFCVIAGAVIGGLAPLVFRRIKRPALATCARLAAEYGL